MPAPRNTATKSTTITATNELMAPQPYPAAGAAVPAGAGRQPCWPAFAALLAPGLLPGTKAGAAMTPANHPAACWRCAALAHPGQLRLPPGRLDAAAAPAAAAAGRRQRRCCRTAAAHYSAAQHLQGRCGAASGQNGCRCSQQRALLLAGINRWELMWPPETSDIPKCASAAAAAAAGQGRAGPVGAE
jgi:hypothetical protein